MEKINYDETKLLIEELTETILDQRIGDTHQEKGIIASLQNLYQLLVAHEKTLSKLEATGKDIALLEKYEKELLSQFKQYDRLLHMANMSNPASQSASKTINRDRILQSSNDRVALLGKSDKSEATESKDALIDMGDGELLQLQDRIMDQQDQQLDSLAQVLGRQKKIGELIGQSLDEQVGMLDHVDDQVDRVQNGLNSASNRAANFLTASSADSNLCYMIIVLFLVLILVIYLTRIL